MTIANQSLPCLVCGTQLEVRLARGRKSGKPFVFVVCPRDGRHFRGFIADKNYVQQVLARLEGQTPDSQGSGDLDTNATSSRRSKTDLERDSRS